MKPMKLPLFACAILALCMPLAAFADSATFLNDDGTITASHSDDLTLTNSELAGISNLGAFDCSGVAACNGLVNFTTGQTKVAGGSLTGNASFTGGPASSFTITRSNFTFSGSFSNATWTESNANTPNEFWTFVGTIMGGTLNENGVTVETGINGATIDLTTLGSPIIKNGFNTWTDAGGTTTFPSPVPEPGTLTLLGSGLIVIGMVARRRRTKRVTASQ